MKKMDNVVLGTDIIIEKGNKVVLITRGHEPFRGKLALPGGRVNDNENVEEAAVREAKEETSLKVKLKEILGVYSGPNLDPRGYANTTVFVADIVGGDLEAGDDAGAADFYDIKNLDFNKIGFPHHQKIL